MGRISDVANTHLYQRPTKINEKRQWGKLKRKEANRGRGVSGGGHKVEYQREKKKGAYWR
jgi:hypothetical protein